jgi:hypothetical protein
VATVTQALASLGEDSLLIEREGAVVAALVPAADMERMRQVRGQRALAAMNRLSDAIEASGATEEELCDLEKALGRKA